MRLSHIIAAAALLAAPFATAETATAQKRDFSQIPKYQTEKIPPQVIPKKLKFDCGSRPCNYIPKEKIGPIGPDPVKGPANRIPAGR